MKPGETDTKKRDEHQVPEEPCSLRSQSPAQLINPPGLAFFQRTMHINHTEACGEKLKMMTLDVPWLLYEIWNKWERLKIRQIEALIFKRLFTEN